MKIRVSNSIYIGKDAYLFLKEQSRYERCCSPLNREQLDVCWERATKSLFFDDDLKLFKVTDGYFGGGDRHGRTWGWSVETMKQMLVNNGFEYVDGQSVQYIYV